MTTYAQKAVFKVLAVAAVFAFVFAVWFATPASASAQSNSAIQAQIEALLRQIQHLQAQLGKGHTTGGSCVNLSHDMWIGRTDAQTGGDVSRLQTFLGVSPTGYFGTITEQAVKNWQARAGLIAHGNPYTTGWGMVGATTRAHMAKSCDGGANVYGEDLLVSNLELDEDEWDLEDDDENEFTFDIRNTFNRTVTVEYEITFEADDNDSEEPNTIRDDVRIPANSVATVDVELDAEDFDEDDYEIEVEIDTDDDFDETSESNNSETFEFETDGESDDDDDNSSDEDISVEDIEVEFDPWFVDDEEDNEITFEIINDTDEDQDIDYRIRVYDEDDNIVDEETDTVDINENDSEVVDYTLDEDDFDDEDEYTIIIEVDFNNEIVEEDEDNNEEEEEFEVEE